MHFGAPVSLGYVPPAFLGERRLASYWQNLYEDTLETVRDEFNTISFGGNDFGQDPFNRAWNFDSDFVSLPTWET